MVPPTESSIEVLSGKLELAVTQLRAAADELWKLHGQVPLADGATRGSLAVLAQQLDITASFCHETIRDPDPEVTGALHLLLSKLKVKLIAIGAAAALGASASTGALVTEAALKPALEHVSAAESGLGEAMAEYYAPPLPSPDTASDSPEDRAVVEIAANSWTDVSGLTINNTGERMIRLRVEVSEPEPAEPHGWFEFPLGGGPDTVTRPISDTILVTNKRPVDVWARFDVIPAEATFRPDPSEMTEEELQRELDRMYREPDDEEIEEMRHQEDYARVVEAELDARRSAEQ